ncbi:MAG: outer membrane beta-barrel protein [Xanthobacteraceae bacterium]|nr:outer membrane beta-barrel protein [Xanthobacteraceae bacterium]
MKKVLVAAALVATGTGARAADLPAKATPYYKAPVAKVYDWTGFYVGVNGGTGFGRSFTPLTNRFGGNASSRLGGWGALGGGQIGYNWQHGNFLGLGNVVFGLEADIQGSAFNDDRTCEYGCMTGSGALSVNQKLDWFGTVRGRVGLATGPVLSYVTGGLAYGGVNTTVTILSAIPPNVTSFSNTNTGWTLGSGVEAALGGAWTGKIEYLYVSLGTQSGDKTGVANSYLFRSEVNEQVFRAGLNYRMGERATDLAEPVARWAGFYGGIDVGGAAAINRSSLTYPMAGQIRTDTFNLSSTNGFTGGGQLGYNFQSANWVLGIETDLQGSTQQDNKACEILCNGVNTAAFDQKLDWLGTTRGRIGYSIGSTLFYFTGGAAYGDVKTNIAGILIGAPFNQTFTHTKAGYTVGGGIESPFNLFGWFGPNWTAKTEYLYVDLGRTSDFIPLSSPTVGMTFSTHVREDLFRTGLNYHFNEPVVAKY